MSSDKYPYERVEYDDDDTNVCVRPDPPLLEALQDYTHRLETLHSVIATGEKQLGHLRREAPQKAEGARAEQAGSQTVRSVLERNAHLREMTDRLSSLFNELEA